MTGQASLLPASTDTGRPLSMRERRELEIGRRGLAQARAALEAAKARRVIELDEHTTAA